MTQRDRTSLPFVARATQPEHPESVPRTPFLITGLSCICSSFSGALTDGRVRLPVPCFTCAPRFLPGQGPPVSSRGRRIGRELSRWGNRRRLVAGRSSSRPYQHHWPSRLRQRHRPHGYRRCYCSPVCQFRRKHHPLHRSYLFRRSTQHPGSQLRSRRLLQGWCRRSRRGRCCRPLFRAVRAEAGMRL